MDAKDKKVVTQNLSLLYVKKPTATSFARGLLQIKRFLAGM